MLSSVMALAASSNGIELGEGASSTAANANALGVYANASGVNSTAIGTQAAASETDAIALGSGANSSTQWSIAIGKGAVNNYNSTITTAAADGRGNAAIAIGYGASTSDYGTTAIGLGTKASGNMATALGSHANATNTASLAVGDAANASGLGSAAIGYDAVANSTYSTAVGHSAKATDIYAIAIGDSASASEDHTIAMGYLSNATKFAAISVGIYSKASGHQANALGYAANASGSSANAFGSNATAAGDNSIAVGTKSIVTQSNAVAVGTTANASGIAASSFGALAVAADSFATALGSYSNASGSAAVSIGHLSKALAEQTIALGEWSLANATASLAIGEHANATAKWATAIGSYSNASAQNAVAMGHSANAGGTDSIAIGTLAAAQGEQAVSVGYNNNVTGNRSGSLGDASVITGNAAYSVGNNNKINANGSFVLGSDNVIAATANNTYVIGNNISVTAGNNVILGANSSESSNTTTNGKANQVTAATVGSLTYGGFAGTASGVVSVGAKGAERQIINVAPGNISATSTDAINGSQLYATNTVLNNTADSVVNILGGNANVVDNGTVSMTNIGGTGKNNVNDAVAAVNNTVAAGTNTNVTGVQNADGSTTYTVNAWNTTLKGSDEISVTNVTDSAGRVIDYSVDLSDSAKNNITTANNTANLANTTANAANHTANIANNTANLANATVNKGWNLTTAAAGGGNVVNSTAENVQMGETVTLDAGKNVNVTQSGQTISIAVTDKPTFESVTANTSVNVGDTTLTSDGITILNGAGDSVSVTKEGLNNGNNTVTNVAPGVKGTDAVNLNQLNAVKSNVAAGTNTNVTDVQNADGSTTYTVNAWNTTLKGSDEISVTNVTDSAGRVIDYSVDLSDSAKNNITTANNTANIANNTANLANATVNKGWNLTTTAAGGGNVVNSTAENVQMGETVTLDAGKNVNVTQSGQTISIAVTDKPTFESVTANTSVNVGDTTLTSDGITIVNGAGDSVSVTKEGLNNGNNTITNVAPGVKGTDAVNLDQLNATTGAAKTILENGTTTTVTERTGTNGQSIYSVEVNRSNGSVNKNGTVTVENGDAILNARTVANLINNSSWSVNAGSVTGTNGVTHYAVNANSAIRAGDTVNYNAGKNIVIGGEGHNVTIATNPNATFDSVAANASFTVGTGENATTISSNSDGLVVANSTAGDAKIQGVANATLNAESKDAVNGSQLYSTNNNVTNLTNEVAKGWNMAVVAENGSVTYVGNDKVSQINMGDTVSYKAGQNINLIVDATNNTITIATSATPNFTSVEADTVNANTVNAGSVTINNTGINAGNTTITNVAAPVNPTDAANKDYVDNAGWYVQNNGDVVGDKITHNQSVNFANGNGTVTKVKVVNGTATISVDVANTALSVNENGTVKAGDNTSYATANDVANAVNHAGWTVNSTAVGTGKVSGDTEAAKVTAGSAVNINAGNNIEIARKGAEMTVATSMTPEYTKVSVGNGAVTIGGSTGKDGVAEVSVADSKGAPTRVTNVAPGVSGTDAVNMSQLNNSVTHFNTNMNALNHKLDKVDKTLRAGIAGATAIGFIQRPNEGGKSIVSVGVGGYKGESAVAVGYARNSDNNKISIKLGAGMNSRSDVNFGGSIGYQW